MQSTMKADSHLLNSWKFSTPSPFVSQRCEMYEFNARWMFHRKWKYSASSFKVKQKLIFLLLRELLCDVSPQKPCQFAFWREFHCSSSICKKALDGSCFSLFWFWFFFIEKVFYIFFSLFRLNQWPTWIPVLRSFHPHFCQISARLSSPVS